MSRVGYNGRRDRNGFGCDNDDNNDSNSKLFCRCLPQLLQCWCRDPAKNPAGYNRHGTATCDMACTGSLTEKCGGSWSVSVYRTERYSAPPTASPTASPTPNPSYLGCFIDQHPRREGTRIFSMQALTSDDGMSSSVSNLERILRAPGLGRTRRRASGAWGAAGVLRKGTAVSSP